MTTCNIEDECVTPVIQLIELDPQPFIMEPEPIVLCTGKLCEAVSNPGPWQGPPIEYLIGREELLTFMFSNEFPPISPAVVPLPPSAWMLVAAIALLTILRKRKAHAV